ncbi:MAG TPA: lasso peptide biosynthesis B2 protein [Bryobacteraceae bacterium]|nr:lasso peptide biosynthesis B2 protein [Bryobacteraceae bacterium]
MAQTRQRKSLSRLRRAPLVLEAFCFLTVARFAIALLPFSWIAGKIAVPRSIQPVDTEDAIKDVCNAIGTAVRRLMPSAVCLPQALAGHWMLYRRGIPSAVCFGARRDAAAGLQAHAWLRAGGRAVLGEKTVAGFTPLVHYPMIDLPR